MFGDIARRFYVYKFSQRNVRGTLTKYKPYVARRYDRARPRSIEKRSFNGRKHDALTTKRQTVSGNGGGGGGGYSNASRVADNFIEKRACTLQPANANCFGRPPERMSEPAIEMLYGPLLWEAQKSSRDSVFARIRAIRGPIVKA